MGWLDSVVWMVRGRVRRSRRGPLDGPVVLLVRRRRWRVALGNGGRWIWVRVLPLRMSRGRNRGYRVRLACVVKAPGRCVRRLVGIVAVVAKLWHMLLLLVLLLHQLLCIHLLPILLLPLLLLHLLLLPLDVELLLLMHVLPLLLYRVLLPLKLVLLRVLPLDLELLLQLLLPRNLLALELLDLALLRFGPLPLLSFQYHRLFRVVRNLLLGVAVAHRGCAVDDHRRARKELLAIAHRILYLRLDVPVEVVKLRHQARVHIRELRVVREHLARRAA